MTDEAPRPDPDFRVYVQRGADRVDVTHAVMDVYDIAISSMDFGSGFLSTEEVGNLRQLGAAIGAERFDYQHDKCLRCGQEYDCHWGPDKIIKATDVGCNLDDGDGVLADYHKGWNDDNRLNVRPCQGYLSPAPNAEVVNREDSP